jgi:predicted transcriptional regulator
MIGQRRNSVKVSVDILKTAKGGAKKTKIVYGSNLNFEIIKKYLNALQNNGLLEIDEEGRYITTSKGMQFVEDYNNLLKPLNMI